MKKLLTILLAMVMCVSFCACGGSNNTTNDTTNVADVANNASDADFQTIYDDCVNNIVSAKNNYVGKTYKFAGTVDRIEEDSIWVVPMKFPVCSSLGSKYYIEVFMPTEEIMKVENRQIINVAGEISDLSDNSSPKVSMENGIVIDDVIAFEGEITKFFLNESYTKHVIAVENNTGVDSKIIYYYEVKDADKFENIEEAVIDGITFSKGDYVRGTAKIEANGAYYNSFNIVEIISIEKN